MSEPNLAVLTWNLALLARAAGAPLSWEQANSEEEIRKIVLFESPDVVFFQELPGLVPYIETHDLVPAQTISHSGVIATLLGNDLLTDQTWIPKVVKGCAVLVTCHERNLTLANVHLAPGTGDEQTRLTQLGAIAEASPTQNLVILGDTNTRAAELDAIQQLGFRTHAPPRPTWDSARNPFHHRGPTFKATFTRGFDRGEVSLGNQRVLDGAVDQDGSQFHISDHFGLLVEVC